ncbi:hypothetical protein EV641_109167 [Rhodococcus sp. SMB37]|uniref:hypothetical protein n=1 Tax=Rhodococcus sp. SMB37 TaxID=2512213 RepID=UPI001046542A|nr:hypothetical protein [Rhodococcus sp. SMB37]TCN51776.1 hypothetical protein EV641_109167 [Rhodococcus sp. SMB37]
MTGTAKVKPAKDDAEWARNTQRRLEQVEHPASSRIGNWVLSTDSDTGDLIASNVNGGSVVIANEPEDGGDADVVASGWSHLKVSRQNPQTLSAGNHIPIEWDTVDTSTDDWNVATGSSTLVFPDSGIWLMTYNVRYGLNSAVAATGRIYLDGSPVVSGRHQPSGTASEPTILCSSTFSVSAGSELYCTAWLSGGGNYTVGPSNTVPSDVTSLSLLRLPIGT